MKSFALLFFLYPMDVCIFKTSSASTCGDLVYIYLVVTRSVGRVRYDVFSAPGG